MNRRESIRAIGLSTLSAAVLLEACKTGTVSPVVDDKANGLVNGRQPFETARDSKLKGETFFTAHEMQAITVLADIIIPADEHSGSATDAKVPEFIEFIVKDIPDHQVPMRGGLRWLDMESFSRFSKNFVEASHDQQLEIVNEIAYPLKARAEMKPGVAFFNRMRDLVASGFFTSQIGIKDLGYVGNVANKWEGVPKDILAQYGFGTTL